MILPSDLNFLIPFETELVRIGPAEDGGYVLPKIASTDSQLLYSLGISNDWRFEAALFKGNPRLKIRAFDRNSGSLIFLYIAIRNLFNGYVTGPNELFSARLAMSYRYFKLVFRFRMFFRFRRHFYRKWVRSTSTNSDSVSLVKSINAFPKIGNLMVKIDIEGGEYDLSDDLAEVIKLRGDQLTCLVVEFHETESRRLEFSTLVSNIQRFLPIVHIHGNNCAPVAADGLPTVLEMTFARKELVSNQQILEFPRFGLDCPNDIALPDLQFSFGS